VEGLGIGRRIPVTGDALPRIEKLRKNCPAMDNRSVVFFGNGVGNDDRESTGQRRQTDWHLIDRAAVVVAGPGVYAVMDRAEIGRRFPLGSQPPDVKHAKASGPFGPALIGSR
jgi:hypothetical protein